MPVALEPPFNGQRHLSEMTTSVIVQLPSAEPSQEHSSSKQYYCQWYEAGEKNPTNSKQEGEASPFVCSIAPPICPIAQVDYPFTKIINELCG
jgi:hypothetical protein